ncbi:MAG TPA: hypothetical protein VEI58_01080 [Chthoniobacterales bacterium]|nr:hypothetical protein [Chthoniobacterales bacterium]
MSVLLVVNWEAVSAIGQVVGAVAVVISLIYLAHEVRNTARATRLESMRSLSESINQFFRTVAQDDELADFFYRGMHDFGANKGGSLLRFSALMDYLFRIYEDMYYQHLERRLDPRVWSGFEAIMRDMNAYPGVQAWWRTRSHWFSDRFRKFIAERQAAAGTPSLYGEEHSSEYAAAGMRVGETLPEGERDLTNR